MELKKRRNSMNKQANTPVPLSPDEAYLASRLFGGSLFSAIQLNKEIEKVKQLEKEKNLQDVLRIPLPVDKLKIAEESEPGMIGRALRLNRSPIRFVAGADHGFQDAAHAFHMAEKAEIARQLEKAQREYLNVLQQIKTAEETPCVDSFCSGVAAEAMLGDMYKQADEEVSDGAIKRVLGDLLGLAKKPIQPVLDVGATGILGTAAGSGYLTYLLKKHMRGENNQPATEPEPTRVELVPV